MRISVSILAAAAMLGISGAVALAEGPYDNSPSYWTRVERWQDCAWKAQESPYPPAFSYGPTHSCAYGSPGAQYYTPPYVAYRYPYYPYGPYYR
jgi:hypothetical protein